jgi:hypothetical protein
MEKGHKALIQFKLELSINQIAVLRYVEWMSDDANRQHSYPERMSQFLVGSRILKAENLISCSQELVKINGRTEIEGWKITEKGKLVLRLIEMDVQDFAESLALRKQGFIEDSQRRQSNEQA